MFKYLAALLLAASPVMASMEPEDHIPLVETLEEIGVDVRINPKRDCMTPGMAGVYNSPEEYLIICHVHNNDWSYEDLDTIRHEAQHVVQDCIGERADSKLDNMFDYDDLKEFVAESSLTVEEVKGIIKMYEDAGASDHVILLELEAWAVARDVPPADIADALKHYCQR